VDAHISLPGKQTLRITLRGDVDITEEEHLDEVGRIVDLWQPSRLLIDLPDVASMDSTGLAFLLRLARAQQGRDGTLELVSPSDQVRRLLIPSGNTDLLGDGGS